MIYQFLTSQDQYLHEYQKRPVNQLCFLRLYIFFSFFTRKLLSGKFIEKHYYFKKKNLASLSPGQILQESLTSSLFCVNPLEQEHLSKSCKVDPVNFSLPRALVPNMKV